MNVRIPCGARFLDLTRPRVMGVLNLTTDSFSDGGELLLSASTPGGACLNEDALLRRADQMVLEGADLLDLGAESTRPGATAVEPGVELDRIVRALELLAPRFDTLLSVDSSSAEVFTAAAGAGAHLLNDVRALRGEGALSAAAATGLPVCLMHMQGAPRTMQQAPTYADVVGEVLAFLGARMDAAVAAGIRRELLLVDPGFGFGKTLAHNVELLRGLGAFGALGAPMLVGVSRKRMIGALTGREVDERLAGSVAAAALAVAAGARIVRTHDVAATRDAVRVAAAITYGIEEAGGRDG